MTTTTRPSLLAYYREAARRWRDRVAAAELANDDTKWALAMSGLNRAEAELAGLVQS